MSLSSYFSNHPYSHKNKLVMMAGAAAAGCCYEGLSCQASTTSRACHLRLYMMAGPPENASCDRHLLVVNMLIITRPGRLSHSVHSKGNLYQLDFPPDRATKRVLLNICAAH